MEYNINSSKMPQMQQMTQMPQQAYGQFAPNPRLATAYIPFQHIACLYPPMEGLKRGTIFPELYRPYGVDPEYTVDA